MKTHELVQGSAEWLAYRATHFNASDAPAMMGCSPYKTRTQLMHELHTGLAQEVDAVTRRRFDDGHRYEALARPLAAAIIGESLFPVVGSEGVLSASFDGLTMGEDTAFEHKSLNDDLRACMRDEGNGCDLPRHYQIQMEQQLMVSGAERVLFMASKWAGDTLVEERHCWYASDPKLAAQIRAGWAQFDLDLAAYVPDQVVEPIKPVGHSPDQLPTLHSAVTGKLVLESNIKEWETAALAYIKGVRDHELKTDEDFANADAAADWCESSKTKLEGVRANLMSATGDVNTAVLTLDRIMVELDKTRIAFNNAIKVRKEARKTEIVVGARAKLTEHLQELVKLIGEPYLPPIHADFASAIKGMRSFAKMEDAVNTTLANAKIEANTLSSRIQTNLKLLRETAGDHLFLFADTAQIVLKANDDFAALVKIRVADHVAAEAVKKAAEAPPAQVTTAQVATETIAAASAPALGIVQQIPASTLQTPAANSGSEQTTIKLGDINARITPLSISADGMTLLGFDAIPGKGVAKMYLAADFPRIRAAMVAHLQKAEQLLAA